MRIRTVDRESIPFPARHLVNERAYRSIVSRRLPMTSMITGSGCPYRCVFCSVPHRANPYFRGVEHVAEEMLVCERLGYREIMFCDDIFTLNRERTLQLCRLIRDKKIVVEWDCRTRVDCVDRELLVEMKASGCFRVQYGVESGSDRILENLNKRITVEQARRAIRETKAAGISPSVGFMLGSPGETESDIERTIAFALQSDPDYVQFSICTPFPFTPLYRKGIESGLINEDYWRKYAEQPDDSFVPRFWCENLNAEALTSRQKAAFRTFYFRPRYIARQLMSLRTFSEARRKIELSLRLAWETMPKPFTR
jgi:anaerobic magnesium-protoporphyrin IX monomethyl ester cyclase